MYKKPCIVGASIVIISFFEHLMWCCYVYVSAGIRVVSNAGGVNPHACVAALRDAAAEEEVDLKVATVTGDDFMNKVNL